MTGAVLPTLVAANRDGDTATLTFSQEDGSIATVTVAVPMLHGFDVKVCNPSRVFTLYPEGQQPFAFWVSASLLRAVSALLSGDSFSALPDQNSYHEWDTYMATLPCITGATKIPGELVLKLVYTGGRERTSAFDRPLTVKFGIHEPGEPFTRFPISVT